MTIASPNGGSRFANGFTKWLAGKIISVPVTTVGAIRDVLSGRIPQVRGRTGIDDLSPDSRVLQVLRNTKTPHGISHHNIVGAWRRWPFRDNSDGLIPVSSARFPDV